VAAVTQQDAAAPQAATQPVGAPARRSRARVLPLLGLALGAVVFLFPFWYMVVGALQREPDTGLSGAFPSPGNLTGDNFIDINRAINLARTLLNSGIFTGGVLLTTLVLGLLAGYALAQLEFRGRGLLFNVVLPLLIVPFRLLMIPLYVMIVRWYGLADNYLGMILPYAVNGTAVFVFRQFFLQLPRELFEAARIDGASELRTLTRVAIPLARPAILSAVILTFIGPWNEFLWPFLVTKQADMQPLAVALANFISTVSGRQVNPFGAILAGACVLALPAVVVFLAFQRHFTPPTSARGSKGSRWSAAEWASGSTGGLPSGSGW
jgi:multiple sugar transport system permease protein